MNSYLYHRFQSDQLYDVVIPLGFHHVAAELYSHKFRVLVNM